MESNRKIENFFNIIKKFDASLQFKIAEIGAHPHDSEIGEPFHILLDFFPNSKIYAFDIDKNECEKLNKSAKKGLKFYPFALGKKNEIRKFYVTNKPECSSLYKPNEKLLKLYNNLSGALLKDTKDIQTITLDEFCEKETIKYLDFIKIDVQGAELDVLQGAKKSLENILCIITEVEFIDHYIDQPLYGDICSYLSDNDLMFQKFLGVGGRTLHPIILKNNINFATQHIWSDAVFIKNILKISELENSHLLKLSIFAYIYGSLDLTFFCLNIYDRKNNSNALELFKKSNQNK
tara:strand:- start:263 stop:1138 length:876 start_codon:yes stop_codon:yes gene_type:complete